MDKKSDEDKDAAQAALAELQAGLSHAKELVERTRSLLAGETPSGEGEAGITASPAADPGEASPRELPVDPNPKPA